MREMFLRSKAQLKTRWSEYGQSETQQTFGEHQALQPFQEPYTILYGFVYSVHHTKQVKFILITRSFIIQLSILCKISFLIRC